MNKEKLKILTFINILTIIFLSVFFIIGCYDIINTYLNYGLEWRISTIINGKIVNYGTESIYDKLFGITFILSLLIIIILNFIYLKILLKNEDK